MFTDPQSVTINGVATSMPRVSSSANQSTYKTADQLTQFALSSQYGRRVRRMARLDSSKIAADPLTAGQSLPVSMSAYLVVDVPLVGYTIAEQKYYVDALTGWLTLTSGSNVTKLLGGEN
jgi:hypothetical protein